MTTSLWAASRRAYRWQYSLTGLMLGDSDEFTIPIAPSGPEVRDFAGTEAEAATERTDKPRLNVPRGRKVPTGLQ